MHMQRSLSNPQMFLYFSYFVDLKTRCTMQNKHILKPQRRSKCDIHMTFDTSLPNWRIILSVKAKLMHFFVFKYLYSSKIGDSKSMNQVSSCARIFFCIAY